MSAALPPELARTLTGRKGPALLVTRNNTALAEVLAGHEPNLNWDVRDKDSLRGWGPRKLVRLLRSCNWQAVIIEDSDVEFDRRRDLYALLAALSRGETRWLLASGDGGSVRRVAPTGELPRLAAAGLGELWSTACGVWSASRLTGKLGRVPSGRKAPPGNPRIAVLKSDFWFGVAAGGSIAHTVGVIDGMLDLGLQPAMWTSAAVPGVARRIQETVVPPPFRPSFVDEAGMAAYNAFFLKRVLPEVRAFNPAVIYQRHGVFSVVGLAAAQALNVPLVLEVNSSEVWVRKSWSRLTFTRLAERMERTAFAGAERLALVSEALRPVVQSMGGSTAAMVVASNGVDVSRFHPEHSGASVRGRLGISRDAVLCGFIGTYHKWHGVLFLAEQAVPLLQRNPSLHFLFMGDGDLRGECQAILREAGVDDRVAFTGLIPADDVPEHLAACDILLSPHLPFEDGSRFFGSPTKLFEYLAAGRPVVASALGQIGDVVQNGVTGLLIPPGDGPAFQKAIERLAADPDLRRSLGAGAREKAVRDHTWKANVQTALGGILELYS